MSEHAYYPPSSAEQWANCTGAARAIAENPQPETTKTRNGTAAHWVASETLLSGGDVCAEFIGCTTPNGVVIDDAMVDGAQVYVDDVLDVCEQFNARHLLAVEFRVHMDLIDPEGENWGTLDAALWLPDVGRMFVWDYKHGHAEVVAYENLQLIDYAEGLCEHHQINGAAHEYITVDLRVVQPFAYRATGPVSKWECKLSDLRPHWNKLAGAIGASRTNPTLSTGYHCRYCPAVGKCAATRGATYNFIELVGRVYEMDAMTTHDLAVELDALDKGIAVAKRRADAIRDDLTHRVANGDGSSGLVLETVAGREEWTAPDSQVIALASQFGVDAVKPALKTPKQLIDATPRELRAALSSVLKQFKRRKTGSLKLTRAEDSRTARAFQPKKEG